MIVKVMSGEAAVSPAPVPVNKAVPDKSDLPVQLPDSQRNVGHRASRSRRSRGSFGDILFVQLILSAVLVGGIWSGVTFGGDEVREICGSIMALFA